VQEALLRHP